MALLDSFGAVAQLGERCVRNAEAVSSILIRSTKNFFYKLTTYDFMYVALYGVQGFEGSNLSTRPYKSGTWILIGLSLFLDVLVKIPRRCAR